MKKIQFQDNTIRDGMQQKNIPRDIFTKKKILSNISTMDINSVEIGMCSSTEDIRLMEEYINILRTEQEAAILTRMIKEEIDLVLNLQKRYRNTVLKLLVPVSDLHIEVKLGTKRNIYINKVERILSYLSKNYIKFEVCLEDSTRAEKNYLFKILDICNKYGANFVTLADTIGCSTPKEYGNLFKNVKERNYAFKISAHCHNDLGLGTANSLSAIENGADRVETTFLGIGERAGNVPIDEIVMILGKKEIFDCTISIKDIYTYSTRIQEILGINVSPLKPLLGKNFFVHESGIHQDGTLKHEEMYQYISLKDIGKDANHKFNISGIASSKIIKKYFENILGKDCISIDEYTKLYRIVAKAINDITPEQFLELYDSIDIGKGGATYEDSNEEYSNFGIQ